MHTLGNLGARRVQDASAKRMVGGRKITREGSPQSNNIQRGHFAKKA